MKNINTKGRSKYSTEQYLGLGYTLLNHPNFRALGGAAVKVLMEMGTKHTGFNNGRIAMSYDDMAETLHMGKTTAYRACGELEYFGFIKLKKLGHFHGRKANEWEITFLKSEGYHPTHDWKQERPRRKKRPSRPRPFSAVDEIVNSPEYRESRQRNSEARYLNEILPSSMVSK